MARSAAWPVRISPVVKLVKLVTYASTREGLAHCRRPGALLVLALLVVGMGVVWWKAWVGS